jgi:hypothetical protein
VLQPAGPDESAAGVLRSEFSKVFTGNRDACGSSCAGYTGEFPNTQAVIDKHWGHFKSAAAAVQFSLQVRCCRWVARWLCVRHRMSAATLLQCCVIGGGRCSSAQVQSTRRLG